MIIDSDARLYIYWDAEMDADPTGSTVIMEIDDHSYDMDWLNLPVQVGVRSWKQTARSSVLFAGSGRMPIGTDARLAIGTHTAKPIVTFADGQRVPCTPTITITAN